MSRIKRRSANAVIEYCKLIGWEPDAVIQAGVGAEATDAFAMAEAWPDAIFVGIDPLASYELRKKYPGDLYAAAAVSDEHQTHANLYVKPRHADGSTLKPYDGREMPVKVVPARTLDSICAPRPFQNGLLWLDCEGSELDALRGSCLTLNRVRAVNVETTGRPPGSGWASPLDIYCFLRDFGFFQAWQHTNRVKGGQCDLIFVHEEILDPSLCSSLADALRFFEEKGSVK